MVRTALTYARSEKLEGDYAEFGVYRGQTFVEAWHAVRDLGLDDMRLAAFDSFEGLPELSERDRDGPFIEGEFATTRGELDQTLKRHRVPPKRVQVVEGFFSETLNESRRGELPAAVAVALVDCDLYESTVDVLEYLGEVLVDGAVLIFDDWFCFRGRTDRGEQLACREWLQRNPGFELTPYRDFHYAGRSFLFHRD
jgi:hypothetical protein